MGRDLALYISRVSEEKMLKDKELICLPVLWCDRGGGEFLTQCDVYEGMQESDIPVVLNVKPIPEGTYVCLVDHGGRMTHVTHDRVRQLHYCVAKDFHYIDLKKCDNSRWNKGAVMYCRSLPPDTVVIVYIV